MEGNLHQRILFDAAKEMKSPRFRAILRATSGRRRRNTDVKSFSHELNSKGSQQPPIRKLRGLTSPEAVTRLIRSRFTRLKQEVNSELGVYAGDLVGILEKTTGEHPEWRERIEDLLVTSQKCAEMSPDEFWLKCEGIVQNLDDRRQELPMGTLKQAHTRILFILTRCTRLLQLQKEGAYGEEEHVLELHQFSDLGFYPEESGNSAKDMKDRLIRKKIHERRMSSDSPGERNRIASWKKFPSAAEKNQKKIPEFKVVSLSKKILNSLPRLDKTTVVPDAPVESIKVPKQSDSLASATVQPIKTDYSIDQPGSTDGKPKMICRVCEFEIPTLHAEGHFRVCTVADRCDMKGLSVDERLERVVEILEKIMEFCEPKNLDNGVNDEVGSVCTSCLTEESADLSPYRSNSSCLSSSGTPKSSVEASTSPIRYHMKDLPSIACNAEYATTHHVTLALSSGNRTPQSPLLTPRTPQMDLLLNGKGTFPELENFQQIQSLLNIVRCIACIKTNDYSSLEYLNSYLEDLIAIIDDRKVDGLVVETFGKRVEKLLQEKFIHLCGQIDDGNKDSLCITVDEDGSVENGSAHSSRMSPLCVKLKDRTSIEDFEIIKPISRGAFGRVFLAKKRITGDLFAIKVLKKADMIRKNAVESILAERNILISARNPFVVRFYYSFTCRENLYLVMEYLNGGDLYSLLRNLGCLDEKMARTYIAELVLALEYLHSLNVIHRDLKPDNLLIARDGHIKLTDFGLSKVGLINSTDDLSGPDASSADLLGDHEPMPAAQRAQKREQRRKQSAVGTPDYLAPEILLGMTHGPTTDWWSVGVILFELLVGIPPFNAEHPQKIFDNIMNRDIPWPQIPDELSYEAHDLIDKYIFYNLNHALSEATTPQVLLGPKLPGKYTDMAALFCIVLSEPHDQIANPEPPPKTRSNRICRGQMKSHPFFQDINWDMLARQKADFIPSIEGEDDTSYFTCRHAWNSTDGRIHRVTSNEYDNLTDCSMSCGSSPHSCLDDEDGDEFGHMADFGAPTLNVKYSFSNFSFKNLSLLACMNYDLITNPSKDSENASNP